MKRMNLWPQVALIGLVGSLVAADRGKNIVPRPNDPVPRDEVMKLTGDEGFVGTTAALLDYENRKQ